MDASSHKLNTIGVTDAAGDAPAAVRAHTANAEQRALNQLFGINLPTTTNEELGELVSRRIFDIVHSVYTSLDEAGLEQIISENVQRALRSVDPANRGLSNLDRIQAVAKATYESIPQDLLERFTLATLSTPISMDRRGNKTGRVTFAAPIHGAGTINTDLPFWRERNGTPVDAASLARRISGRAAEDIGLPASWTGSDPLSRADARAIANATDILVMAQPEGVGKCEYEYGPAVVAPAVRPKFEVSVDKIMSESTNSDAPATLQNRPLFTFSAVELEELFQYRGKDGSYPYWAKYCKGPANPYVAITNLDCNHPSRTSVTLAGSAANVASEIVRVVHGHAARTNSIGTKRVTMEEVQRDLDKKVDENRAFLDKLRTGSENSQGAIIAASLALSDSSIYSAVTSGGTETAAKEKVDAAKARIQLLGLLKNLSDLKANLSLKTQVATPTSLPTFEYLEDQRNGLRLDRPEIRETISGAAHSWRSEYMISRYGADNSGLAGAAPTKASERRDALRDLDAHAAEIDKDLNAYREIERSLKNIAVVAANGKIQSATLKNLINGSTTEKRNIDANFDPIKIADDIRKEMKLDESEEQLKKKVTDAEAELAKVKAGGETGDQLQQKVFQEYFKRSGVSPQEAQKSANFLYARSLVDQELRGQIDALHEDLFEDHENNHSKKDFLVASNIAKAVGLHPRIQNGFFRRITHLDWQTRPYPKLITAYYSLKKLYEGSGPEYISSPGSSVYKAQMREIARALSDRHVAMLINDFGNDLPDKDRAELASRKTLSLELMEKMLTGDAPAKYSTRIDQLLSHVDHGTHRYRRGVAGAITSVTAKTVGTAGYLLGAGKNTGMAGYSFLKDNRKNIAACAALTALGGPLGLAVFLGYKAFSAKEAPSGGGGHH